MLRVEALTLNQEGSKREFDYINILHAIKGSELEGTPRIYKRTAEERRENITMQRYGLNRRCI